MEQYVIHNNVPIPAVRYGQPLKREPLADAITRLRIGQCVACDGLSYTGILRAAKTVSDETGRKFLIRRIDSDYWVWRVKNR